MNSEKQIEQSIKPMIPLIVGSAMMIQTINSTVIVNALPAMAESMNRTPVEMNLAITAYLLASATFLPFSGWLADKYGSRLVFCSAIIVFLVSSVLCGLSTTLPQLLAARILGGIAAAAMTPVGRLVVLRTVPHHDLVRAMAMLTMPLLLGPVLGPPIGGFIVTYWSWPWVFYINLPVGIIAALLFTLYVPNIKAEMSNKLDIRGALLTGFGLASLIFGLQNIAGGVLPLPFAIALSLTGTVLITLYFSHAKKKENPILDLKLFKIPTFAAGVIGGQFVRILNGATPFLLALLLQVGFGLSAFTSGLLTFVSAAASLLMKTTAVPILRKIGFRRTLIFNGMILATISSSYAFFRSDTPYIVILGLLLIGGFSRSLQFTSLNTIAYVDIKSQDMSSGSTLLSMSQPLAQSVGVAIAATSVQLFANFQGGQINSFSIGSAFILLGVGSLISLIYFLPLPHDVGNEVTGHKGGIINKQ